MMLLECWGLRLRGKVLEVIATCRERSGMITGFVAGEHDHRLRV